MMEDNKQSPPLQPLKYLFAFFFPQIARPISVGYNPMSHLVIVTSSLKRGALFSVI